MKKIYLSLLIVFHLTCFSQTSYTWSAASGVGAAWTTAGNWTPTRTTPNAGDTLVFDGASCANPIVNAMPASQSIASLQIINNANLILGSGVNSIITIGNSGIAAPHLDLTSGSKLTLNTVGFSVNLNVITGCTAELKDSVIFSGNAHRLTGVDASSIQFMSGSVFKSGTGFSGSPFGTTNLNSVVFQRGSKFIYLAGTNPFAATAPNSVVVFQKGSWYIHMGTTTPSLNGRTYANFEINASTFNNSPTGTLPCRVDTFLITSVNILNYNLTGGLVVSGNFSVLSGIVSFNPASAASLQFDGNVPQQVSGTFTLGTNMKVQVVKNANVTLQTNINIPSDSIAVYGKLYTGNQVISGSGTLFLPPENYGPVHVGANNIGTNTINITVWGGPIYSGMVLSGDGIPANSYVTKLVGNVIHLSKFITTSTTSTQGSYTSRGTLGIGDAAGITSSGATGNIQTTNRVFSTESNYEYTGTADQVTGSGLPANIKNLILNTTGERTITLTNPININDTLNLQNGFLQTSSSILPTLSTATKIYSPSSNYNLLGSISNVGWEKSFINGPVAAQINSNTNRWFPTGKISGTDTLFAPAAVQTTYVSPVKDTVEYFPIAYSDTATDRLPIDHVSSLEYWKINSNVTTTDANGKVTLTWRPFSKVGDGIPANDATALDDLVVAHYFTDLPGTNPFLWHIEGGTTGIMFKGVNSDVNYGTVVTTADNSPITSSSTSPYFTLGTKSPFNILPVKFLDFTATPKLNEVSLKWITKEEKGLLYYELEQSKDAIRFSKIDKVIAANGVDQNTYTAKDLKPFTGWNYYRLKIVEANGKVSYSVVVKAWIGVTKQLLLYPNPAQKEIKIILPGSRSTSTIAIVNSNGQVVKQLTTTDQSATINIEFLNKGVYFVKIFTDQQAFVQKFSKQ